MDHGAARTDVEDGRVTPSRPGPADVLVWTAPAATPLPPHCRSWLDAVEQARAAAMPPAERDAFTLARALLRGALATLLGSSPEQVSLRAVCACGRPHGQVHVATDGPRGGPRLHVSVTRSGPDVAVAVAALPVGVDVTSVAAVSRAPLADVALGPDEAAWWAGDVTDRPHAIARAWARKEAALKALGTGLGLDPSAVDVRADEVRVRLGTTSRTVRLVDLPAAAVSEGTVGAADTVGTERTVGAVAVVTPTGRARTTIAVHLDVRDGAPLLGGG